MVETESLHQGDPATLLTIWQRRIRVFLATATLLLLKTSEGVFDCDAFAETSTTLRCGLSVAEFL